MRWAAGPGQPPAPPLRPAAPPPKKSGGCLRWVLGGLALAAVSCCCLFSAVASSLDDPLDWQNLAPPIAGTTDLGVALVPESLPAGQARHFRWQERLMAFDLGYGLSADEHDRIEDDFQDLSEFWAYQPGPNQTFKWAPPPQCAGREWECIFDHVAKDNADDVAPLTELFRRRQASEKLDSRQLTELVVSFVQHITYRLPTEDTAAFGLLPPAIVVADGSGDCDSKALLSVIVLRQLGVDAQVLLATGLGHAALGVALPVPGRNFALGAKKYAFVEVTAPGWPLGTVPPEYDVARAWRVVPVAVP